ncbi:GTPase/DUF3482 domain-containing protein [Vitreoscilla massiliensis]|uniref:GTPase/DUF3482 domain-containing protein n=1 Tax=Vitreoscilla massiliensis TaxID=1689272 RepID=A0ABY4E7F0_9NEIS|nr:GTPase/DUF3482 domain-containing protein [Vitreoscilla massiliensis]UOO91266.1 GTPase/DUF3482 domain-containing protein [Vitreoscilla massiliensis]
MKNEALNIAVVGHTNTGKTSLLRTLLRDEGFGEVKNAPATTRHVEAAEISSREQVLLRLFDTPGLEDAGGVLDWLEQHTSSRHDGIERIQQLLQADVAQDVFSQEAKVLRQVLGSDVSLYVIDAREPVLAKYKDELTVLSWCAKPVMPVFNFSVQGDAAAWHEMLARRGLHVHSQFDTVAFDFDGEMRLWRQLDTLLNRKAVLEQLQTVRTLEWQGLQDAAWRLMAHFLLEVAALVETVKDEDPVEPVLAQMQNKVRQRERHFQQDVLQAFRFYQQADLPADWMPKAFSQDPFDPELLKQFGLRTSTGAAVGALIGLGVDAATAGLSGGMGAAIGGVIGGVLSNMGSLSDRLSGVKTIHIDPATITLLATRAQGLILALMQRGHAAQQALDLQAAAVIWPNSNLPSPLRRARSHAEWSALNGVKESKAAANRHEAAQELQQLLSKSLSSNRQH